MVQYGMFIDLEKCVGCQTCTVSCKVNNKTPDGVFFNQTNDYEKGEFPDVEREYLPVQCNQCDDPKCVTVCPADATYEVEGGIITIDPDACTGCKSCIVACPYGARFYLDEEQEFDDRDTIDQQIKEANEMGTVTKCDFCIDKVQEGVEAGYTPGEDHQATPHCTNSCIGEARYFGDLDDDESMISEMIEETDAKPLQAEAGTEPNIYYKKR
jgi:phenylacetyl-CoA:acceptor oxidoreductase subunit 1